MSEFSHPIKHSTKAHEHARGSRRHVVLPSNFNRIRELCEKLHVPDCIYYLHTVLILGKQ